MENSKAKELAEKLFYTKKSVYELKDEAYASEA